MMHSASTVKVALAGGALLGAFLTCGCLAEIESEKGSGWEQSLPAAGRLGLAIEIAPGVQLAEVTYVVSGNGIEPLTGPIPLDSPGASISALIGGLPPGSGYDIELTATSVARDLECSGSATFDVSLGQTTTVDLVLACSRIDNGGAVVINVDVDVTRCPRVNSIAGVSPELELGERILFDANASDADTESLSFAWSATSGLLGTPAETATTFECTGLGAATLTLTVSDGRCEDSAQFDVSCVAPEQPESETPAAE
jgi:hypothetical protein